MTTQASAPLHFAHANGFPVATYRQFLTPLSSAFSIHTTDFIGHDPDYPVTDNWYYLREHLIQELEQHGEPVFGVGHSLGGALMFMASLKRPDLFRSVIMLDVPLMTRWEALLLALAKRTPWRDRVTPAGKAARRRSRWPTQEAAFRHMKSRPLFQRFPDEVIWDYIHAVTEPIPDDGLPDSVRTSDWMLSYRPEIEAQIFRTFPTNWTRHYGHHHPALQVIVGAETDVVKAHHRHLIRDKLGIPLHTLPGGHLFPLEHPEATARYLTALLQGDGLAPADDSHADLRVVHD